MKTLIRIGLVSALAVAGNAMAQSATLEELAQKVRDAASAEGKINEQREAEFLRDRNNQRNLLAQARRELAAEEQRSDQLKNDYDQNERQLAELETVLAERMGNLGELFGVVRQAAGDIQATLDDSMVTAQMPANSL